MYVMYFINIEMINFAVFLDICIGIETLATG